jgi:hypothetical protein
MFRPQILPIFRLYNENLSIVIMRVYRVCRLQGGRDVSARSRKCGGGGALDLGWS